MRLVLLFVALVGLVGLSVARPSVLTVSVGQSIDTELGYSTIPIIVRWTSIFSEGEELDGTETGIDSKEIEELILSALGRKPGFEPETETESEPEAEPEPGSPEAAASLESKETDDLLDLDPRINSSTEPEPEAKPEPEPEAKPEPEPEVEEEDESERFLKEIRGILGIDSELKPITEPEPEAKPEPEPEPEPEAEEEEDESERFFKEIRDILGIASGLNPSPEPEQRADPEPNLYSGPGERFYYKTVGGSNNGNGFVFPDLSDYEEPMDFSNFNADLNFSDRDFFLL